MAHHTVLKNHCTNEYNTIKFEDSVFPSSNFLKNPHMESHQQAKQHNPVHAYTEVSLIEFNRTYFQVNMYRIALKVLL